MALRLSFFLKSTKFDEIPSLYFRIGISSNELDEALLGAEDDDEVVALSVDDSPPEFFD
jgi:hypothetical protein